MKGMSALNWNIFIYEGAPPGYDESGLKHALVGQLILVGLATLIGVPLGILAGTYLSEYGKNSKLAHTIRDISDIMMSAPPSLSVRLSMRLSLCLWAILAHGPEPLPWQSS